MTSRALEAVASLRQAWECCQPKSLMTFRIVTRGIRYKRCGVQFHWQDDVTGRHGHLATAYGTEEVNEVTSALLAEMQSLRKPKLKKKPPIQERGRMRKTARG